MNPWVIVWVAFNVGFSIGYALAMWYATRITKRIIEENNGGDK